MHGRERMPHPVRSAYRQTKATICVCLSFYTGGLNFTNEKKTVKPMPDHLVCDTIGNNFQTLKIGEIVSLNKAVLGQN